MTVNTSAAPPETTKPPLVIDNNLRCALTGRVLKPDEAYWAPPLITTADLLRTLVTTLMRTPSNLGHMLFDEQPNVPYAPEVRKELASRRSAEQVKLLLVLLTIVAIVLLPFIWLAL